MNAIVIGCGRVGATLARTLADEGWEVTVVELLEENLSRLGPDWRHPLVLGHGMDTKVLEEAGVEQADVLIAATDGDNTNLVIAQVATQQYHVDRVGARIQDPARAEAYADRGFHIVSPVKMAIEGLAQWALAADAGEDRLMFAIVVGGGKIGANVARTLMERDQEVVLIECKPSRADVLEGEFGHRVIHGDGTELYVLERAGVTRPPDIVVAVTGDDEDNLVISQLSRERYGVKKVIARVNDPRNQTHFDLLGVTPTVCPTQRIMALIEHEVPEHDLVHLLELRKENLEIIEVEVDKKCPCIGKPVEDLGFPTGSRLISIVRDGTAEIAVGATVLREGDQVLAILEPGKENEVRKILLGR